MMISLLLILIILFNFNDNNLNMGNTSSFDNDYSLLTNYTILRQQNYLKILEDNQTEQTFILKQQCFVNRMQYDKKFKKLTSEHNPNCENVLKMVKLWSREHNGLCSSIFKIYCVFQYPKVKLSQQIEARKKEEKYFEQNQLFSIMQSCINAVRSLQHPFCLSPSQIFIIPQGILKIIHPELLDHNYSIAYSPDFYYSPQKIENFGNQTIEREHLQKQIIFSIGMTVLHSALLYNLLPCYEISQKRFNNKKLSNCLSNLNREYNSNLIKVLQVMLQVNSAYRGGIEEVQTLMNEYFSSNRVSSTSQASHFIQQQNHCLFQQKSNIGKEGIIIKDHQVSQFQELQLQTIDNLQKTPLYEIQSIIGNKKLKLNDEQLPKSHQILQKTKKFKMEKINKQNQCTDPKIMQMIKNRIQEINDSSKRKKFSFLQTQNKNQNDVQKKPQQTNKIFRKNSSKDFFSYYELISNKKLKCTFIIQTYEDKSKYEGMALNGIKNGFGKLIYSDGAYYEGNFKNDKINGKGTLYYGKDRPAYTGDWLNDKFHGKGILYNEYLTLIEGNFDFTDFNKIGDNWMKFQGYFAEDKQQGQGKLSLTNGQWIQGKFSAGLLDGQCTFCKLTGQKMQGIWKDNVLLVE